MRFMCKLTSVLFKSALVRHIDFGLRSLKWFRFYRLALIFKLVKLASHKLFVEHLIAKVLFVFVKSADSGHDVSNSPRKDLPFIFAFVFVCLQQVLVGLEVRQNSNLASVGPWIAIHQGGLS